MSNDNKSHIDGLLASWPANVLSIAALGGIEIEEAAHYELSQRGLDANGNNVGAEAAVMEYLEKWG